MVRGLIDSTMPSAMAWRARSRLDQWVRCRPLATGSRQASSTIRARWRGGNPGRSARSLRLFEESREPRVLVEAAGAADRADVTLQPGGDGCGPLARGDRQDRAGAPDLGPRRGLAPRDGLKEGAVMRSDRQGTRSSTTHGAISRIGTALEAQQRRRLEFRARLRARDTRGCPLPGRPV